MADLSTQRVELFARIKSVADKPKAIRQAVGRFLQEHPTDNYLLDLYDLDKDAIVTLCDVVIANPTAYLRTLLRNTRVDNAPEEVLKPHQELRRALTLYLDKVGDWRTMTLQALIDALHETTIKELSTDQKSILIDLFTNLIREPALPIPREILDPYLEFSTLEPPEHSPEHFIRENSIYILQREIEKTGHLSPREAMENIQPLLDRMSSNNRMNYKARFLSYENVLNMAMEYKSRPLPLDVIIDNFPRRKMFVLAEDEEDAPYTEDILRMLADTKSLPTDQKKAALVTVFDRIAADNSVRLLSPSETLMDIVIYRYSALSNPDDTSTNRMIVRSILRAQIKAADRTDAPDIGDLVNAMETARLAVNDGRSVEEAITLIQPMQGLKTGFFTRDNLTRLLTRYTKNPFILRYIVYNSLETSRRIINKAWASSSYKDRELTENLPLLYMILRPWVDSRDFLIRTDAEEYRGSRADGKWYTPSKSFYEDSCLITNTQEGTVYKVVSKGVDVEIKYRRMDGTEFLQNETIFKKERHYFARNPLYSAPFLETAFKAVRVSSLSPFYLETLRKTIEDILRLSLSSVLAAGRFDLSVMSKDIGESVLEISGLVSELFEKLFHIIHRIDKSVSRIALLHKVHQARLQECLYKLDALVDLSDEIAFPEKEHLRVKDQEMVGKALVADKKRFCALQVTKFRMSLYQFQRVTGANKSVYTTIAELPVEYPDVELDIHKCKGVDIMDPIFDDVFEENEHPLYYIDVPIDTTTAAAPTVTAPTEPEPLSTFWDEMEALIASAEARPRATQAAVVPTEAVMETEAEEDEAEAETENEDDEADQEPVAAPQIDLYADLDVERDEDEDDDNRPDENAEE
jgi:hypothetical protein